MSGKGPVITKENLVKALGHSIFDAENDIKAAILNGDNPPSRESTEEWARGFIDACWAMSRHFSIRDEVERDVDRRLDGIECEVNS